MYKKVFAFVDTEKDAKFLCESIKKFSSSYVKKKYPPSYTPWTSSDGKEKKFVVWYHVKA
ncbi:MAG: hypothetical protein II399_03755 [Lachnospiraceae bacterium]|nr:hypothetical protein [Lachnospiraceae bacterium]